MAESTQRFDDGAAYERFMGRWSRAVGGDFLRWVGAPQHADWIDVGCGTGIFTQLILDTCAPRTVIGIDPEPAQIEHARRQSFASRADFRVGDAQQLPFDAASFDIVASALVINFVPDRTKALEEMRRVGRPGGIIAGTCGISLRRRRRAGRCAWVCKNKGTISPTDRALKTPPS